MHQAGGGLIQVPLQMAEQTAMVIEHAHQHGGHPLACAGQDLTRTMMEVPVPQGADVIDLEAAYLQALEPFTGRQRASARRLEPGLEKHGVDQHIASYAGV